MLHTKAASFLSASPAGGLGLGSLRLSLCAAQDEQDVSNPAVPGQVVQHYDGKADRNKEHSAKEVSHGLVHHTTLRFARAWVLMATRYQEKMTGLRLRSPVFRASTPGDRASRGEPFVTLVLAVEDGAHRVGDDRGPCGKYRRGAPNLTKLWPPGAADTGERREGLRQAQQIRAQIRCRASIVSARSKHQRSSPSLARGRPEHPVLSALRSLHEFAFVQFHRRAADDQLPHKEGVAKPENGAGVVALMHAVQHHSYRYSWPGEIIAGRFGDAAPVLSAPGAFKCQQMACRLQYSSANMIVITRSVTEGSDASGEW